MKKIILSAIAMVLLELHMSAQKIIIDQTNQDGSRVIATDSEYVRNGFSDKNPLGYSIGYIGIENHDFYYIDIAISSLVNFELPEGGLLLIKTPSGTVIEAKQTLKDYETDDLLGNTISGVTTHTIRGSYEVTLEGLEKIAAEGIKKIRIEKKASLIDTEYKDKNVKKTQEVFSSRLELMKKTLSKSSDIREGF